MLHSPYLSAKLHIWSDSGRRRLHKLLAKMGVSLTQCKQSYTHMDMELKRGLRERLLKFAPIYGLDGLIPQQVSRGEGKDGWGFVRCWGWKACLSAIDVGVIVGAILEVGDMDPLSTTNGAASTASSASRAISGSGASTPQVPTQDDQAANGASTDMTSEQAREAAITRRFWTAYDALSPSASGVSLLTTNIVTAQHLYRAILRTGTSLLEKKQIRHLRAFRMAVVKEGPDVALFTHPGALIKLALWVAEAITEMEGVKGKKGGELVMAGLDETRGVYVVVGLGGGAGVLAQREKEKRRAERRKERERKREERKAKKLEKKRLRRERIEALGEEYDSALDEEDEDEDTETEGEADSDVEDEQEERGTGLNKFGNAFQEVIEETGARVRVDSFEHSVVEVRKEDLSGFLEALSMKVVVG
jgi:cell division control protein 45